MNAFINFYLKKNFFFSKKKKQVYNIKNFILFIKN